MTLYELDSGGVIILEKIERVSAILPLRDADNEFRFSIHFNSGEAYGVGALLDNEGNGNYAGEAMEKLSTERNKLLQALRAI